MLPTIARNDLHSPTEAGDYAFAGMSVHVDRQHLRAWHDSPDTRFKTILCTRVGDIDIRLTLGDVAG